MEGAYLELKELCYKEGQEIEAHAQSVKESCPVRMVKTAA